MRVSPSRGRSLLWATTYTFDPDLFSQFWFPRMGEPPRNAVVLADHRKLAETWRQIHEREPWRLKSANAQYLVRGVKLGPSFHPKTYFIGDENRGSLFVGSGNLTLGGIEQGKEIFTRFDSETEDGLGAIRSWAAWIESLAATLDSSVVERWLSLRRTAKWLRGDPPSSSSFLTNSERSLLKQIADLAKDPVAELHLTAPFFDESGKAVAELLKLLRPSEVHLYLARDTSVNGTKLSAVLRSSKAASHIWQYDADFVHAKLIGARHATTEQPSS